VSDEASGMPFTIIEASVRRLESIGLAEVEHGANTI